MFPSNRTNQHIRIVQAGREKQLRVVACYPTMGRHVHIEHNVVYAQCKIGKVGVQPVCREVKGFGGGLKPNQAYIVDFEAAGILSAYYPQTFFLSPCDPVMVPEMPSYLEREYRGKYEVVCGGAGDKDTLDYLERGWKIFGYRRLLLNYASDDNTIPERFAGVVETALALESAEHRCAALACEYYNARKNWLDRRVHVAQSFLTGRDIMVKMHNGAVYNFQRDAAGLSQFTLFLEWLDQQI